MQKSKYGQCTIIYLIVLEAYEEKWFFEKLGSFSKNKKKWNNYFYFLNFDQQPGSN